MIRLAAIAIAALVGCGSESQTPAADGDADVDADGDGDPGCNTVDETCPASHPHPGGLCAGDLDCPYTIDASDWTYACVDGAWAASVECYEYGGCVPPLVENCDGPFAGELVGASIEIGPPSASEPFRPFRADDRLPLVWGTQGSPMIAFRTRITGAAAPPECVLARYTLTNATEGSEPTVDRLRLRCGQSLPVYAIVPFGDLACADAAGSMDVRIDVELQGVGTGTVDATIVYGEMENCTL